MTGVQTCALPICKHTDINVPIDQEPLPQHGSRAPKTAIRPDPLPPEERGRLAEAAAELPRKDAYDFDRQDPEAQAAQTPPPGDPARELDQLIASAVTGDTQLAYVPEAPKVEPDPAPEAVVRLPKPPKPAPEKQPEPAPLPTGHHGEGPHPDNTVAPSMEDQPAPEPVEYTFPPLDRKSVV